MLTIQAANRHYLLTEERLVLQPSQSRSSVLVITAHRLLEILLANMMHLAHFTLLFTGLALGLLADATPTPLDDGQDNDLTPRFVQPSGSPDVCFNNHHCLTYVRPSRLARRNVKPAFFAPSVQTIDGGFFGLTLHGCSYSQVVDHTGYSCEWRAG